VADAAGVPVPAVIKCESAKVAKITMQSTPMSMVRVRVLVRLWVRVMFRLVLYLELTDAIHTASFARSRVYSQTR